MNGAVAYNAAGTGLETWQTVTLDAGWTAGVARYRLMPLQNTVFVSIALTHAAFTVNTNINNGTPVPAAYRPLSNVNISGPGIPNRAGGEITSTGVFVAIPNGVSCTECDITGWYPLD